MKKNPSAEVQERSNYRVVNREHTHDRISSNGSNVLPMLTLIHRLCTALDKNKIGYCHWKSNDVLERSANGDNDVDLLISRGDEARFSEILGGLGFKQAEAPAEKRMPGVLDYYGYDAGTDRIVHVHAHYQLVLGHDLTKNYRLPIERPYLESAVPEGLFKVPAPEFEFMVFVIRMILKQSTWDAMMLRNGRLTKAERREMVYLQAGADLARTSKLVKQHLPFVDMELFHRCLQALRPGCPLWKRILIGQQLQDSLKPYARRTQLQDSSLKFWRRLRSGLRSRLLKRVSKRRLSAGGAIIAVVGGDGAGKSTAVDELYAWLASDFETMKIHMGRPRWSRVTTLVRGLLSMGRMLGLYPHLNSSILYRDDVQPRSLPGLFPWMVREICKARDRYLTYVGARRFALNGGLVISDRYPLPQIRLMDGPIIKQVTGADVSGRLANILISMEESYYPEIAMPELVIVLMLDPDVAVQRKTDEKPAEVHVRSKEISEIDWTKTDVHVIDASRTREEVASELKTLIWSRL